MKKIILPLLFVGAFASAQTIREDLKNGNPGSKIHIKNADRALVVSKTTAPPHPPLVLLDGQIKSYEFLNNINPDEIASMTVLKGKMATEKYGDQAQYGAIEISSKQATAKAD